VMLGCMTETSCAISAAAQLAPIVDWVDLDGALLINNDVYEGMKVLDGECQLPDRPGIGIQPLLAIHNISRGSNQGHQECTHDEARMCFEHLGIHFQSIGYNTFRVFYFTNEIHTDDTNDKYKSHTIKERNLV